MDDIKDINYALLATIQWIRIVTYVYVTYVNYIAKSEACGSFKCN